MSIEADLVEPFLISAKKAIECEPITEVDFGTPKKSMTIGGSSNIITVVPTDRGKCVVLKSYRRILSRNNEVEMLRYLASMNFTHIPKLYAIRRYRELFIGAVLEYVKGVDGGHRFYVSPVNILMSGGCNEYTLNLGYEVGRW